MKNIPLNTILHIERLQLRAVSLSDVELVWSASQIKGFNDGMVWDPPDSKEELVLITHKNLSVWADGKSYTFTIDLCDSNTPIGRVGFRLESKPTTWNIGFWVHPDYWGHGYATEATRAVMDFGFSELGVEKITSAHATWNTRSKRVIEKLGFLFICENPCGFMKHGKPVAEYEYAIEKIWSVREVTRTSKRRR